MDRRTSKTQACWPHEEVGARAGAASPRSGPPPTRAVDMAYLPSTVDNPPSLRSGLPTADLDNPSGCPQLLGQLARGSRSAIGRRASCPHAHSHYYYLFLLHS